VAADGNGAIVAPLLPRSLYFPIGAKQQADGK
jgi:hypothetical protein